MCGTISFVCRTIFFVRVKCWDSNSMGMRGYVKEGLELAPISSFDVEQGGY